MRATIKNYIDALKARREELGEENDKGFSLIELIVVVVILGVLAAIAIPIFLNIQDQANQNAVKAAAATGATQVAAQIAKGATVATGNIDNLSTGGMTVSLEKFTSLDDICVKATNTAKTWFAGPGALSNGTNCK